MPGESYLDQRQNHRAADRRTDERARTMLSNARCAPGLRRHQGSRKLSGNASSKIVRRHINVPKTKNEMKRLVTIETRIRYGSPRFLCFALRPTLCRLS